MKKELIFIIILIALLYARDFTILANVIVKSLFLTYLITKLPKNK